MSFRAVNSDNDDFLDAQSCADAAKETMDSVRLDKGISFNPTVEVKSVNGSVSHFPIAGHDGYHNCRQYFNEPHPVIGGGEGDLSEASLSSCLKEEGISFNPTVEAKSVNGSFSRFPIAAHDGFHNCRQYFNEPAGWAGDSSEASLSLNGAVEAEGGSMSWSSGNLLSPSPTQTDTAGGHDGADNMMKGPVLFAGLTAAVHHLTSFFDDDNLEEKDDGASTRFPGTRREPAAEEHKTEGEPSAQREDNKNIRCANQMARNHSNHSLAAKRARAAK